ncbi:MAG: sporulation histidine kinase inhibitor Sda [Neobacillus sp.]
MKLSNLSNESLIDAYYRANLLGLDDSFIELLFEAILARNLNHLLN